MFYLVLYSIGFGLFTHTIMYLMFYRHDFFTSIVEPINVVSPINAYKGINFTRFH